MNRFAFRRQLRRELARGCLAPVGITSCTLGHAAPLFQRSGDARPVEAPAGRPEDITHSQNPPAPKPTPAPIPAPTSPSYRPPAKLIDLSRVSSSMERDWGKARG